MTIRNGVRDIVSRMYDVHPDEINLRTRFAEDLRADYLSIAELVLALEESFDIDIQDEDTMEMLTIRDMIDCIASKVASKKRLLNQ